jgi:hypothetical protein
MSDAHLAQMLTSKNVVVTSFGATHVKVSGMKMKLAITAQSDTVYPVSKVTRTTVTTVVRSAGVATTITVKVMTKTTTATEKTHLYTVTPTDLALLSLEKESII